MIKPTFVSIATKAVMLIFGAVLVASPAGADSISPSVGDIGKVYSTERPDSSYFGTGAGAKLSEASQLRFTGEQLIIEGKIDEAIKKFAKAVQFDPADPGGHLMLARAMTQKIKSNRNGIDWELYGQCLDEWTLLARHDADHLEQQEARTAISGLKRMAKLQVQKAKGKQPKRSFLAGLNPLNKIR
ncbi:MAG: tetratricopeptide repeat protein [Candidatus Obscuribacterales bacterium]|nr:tetratricopeptide repeat protein [Candidatus Obscuribacterales bacterium]